MSIEFLSDEVDVQRRAATATRDETQVDLGAFALAADTGTEATADDGGDCEVCAALTAPVDDEFGPTGEPLGCFDCFEPDDAGGADA